MHRHFSLLSLLLFLGIAKLYSQEFKIDWSEPMSETFKGNISRLVSDNIRVYIVPTTQPTATLLYDNNLSEFRVKQLDYSLKQLCYSALSKPASVPDPDPSVLNIYPKNGKLLTSISSFDKANKSSKKFLLKYENCKALPEVIDFSDMVVKAGLKDSSPKIFETNRNDRMVMFTEETPAKGALKMLQGIILLDENFSQIYSGKIEVDAKSSTLVTEIFVNENDNVFVVLSDARGIKQNFIEIYKFSKEGEVKRNKLLLDEINTGTDDFHLLSDGNIGWAGLYTKKGPSTGTGNEGVFYLKINPETGSKTFSKFQMLNDLDENFKRNVMGSGGLDLLKIFWTDDDAIILVMEKHQTAAANSTNHFYNELSVIKLNAQGSYKWATVIPKEQVLTSEEWNRHFSSVGLLMDESKVCLLFNANPNDNETTAKSMKNFESSQTVLAVLDVIDGKLKRIPLYGNDSEDVVTVPMFFCKGSKSGEFLLVKSNKYTKPTDFAKLKYKIGKIQLN